MAARIGNFSNGPIGKPKAKKQPVRRMVDERHLAFVRTLPCLASGLNTNVEAHHLTVGRHMMGRKADDSCVVPIISTLHTGGPEALHEMGERNFWNKRGIDPHVVAKELYACTGDYDAALQVIACAHIEADRRLALGRLVYPVR